MDKGIRGEKYVEEHRPERTRGEQLRGDEGPLYLKKGKVMSTCVTPA